MPVNTPKLNLPGSVARGDNAGAWHTYWNQICSELEARLAKTGTADPNAGEQGHFVGQYYLRTGAERDIYICTIVGTPGTWLGMLHNTAAYRAPFGGIYVALTSSGGSVTPSLAGSNTFNITLTENTTIQNPTSTPAIGSIVTFEVTQHATLLFTLSWGSAYKGVTSGLLPAYSTFRQVYRFMVASNGDLVRVGPPTPGRVYAKNSADQNYTNTEVVITSLSLTVPGAADGQKPYRVSAFIQGQQGGATNPIFRVRMGAAGTIADTEVFSTSPSGTTAAFFVVSIPRLTLVPASFNKITLTVIGGINTSIIFGGGASVGLTNAFSWLEVEEAVI